MADAAGACTRAHNVGCYASHMLPPYGCAAAREAASLWRFRRTRSASPRKRASAPRGSCPAQREFKWPERRGNSFVARTYDKHRVAFRLRGAGRAASRHSCARILRKRLSVPRAARYPPLSLAAACWSRCQGRHPLQVQVLALQQKMRGHSLIPLRAAALPVPSLRGAYRATHLACPRRQWDRPPRCLRRPSPLARTCS